MPPSQAAPKFLPDFQSQDTTRMLLAGERLPLQVREVRKTERPSIGPIVGSIIIVVLLIFGGLYFWGARLNQEAAKNAPPLIPGSQ